MTKYISRPRKCQNAECVAMCSPADATLWSDNPIECPRYKRRTGMTTLKKHTKGAEG